MGYVFFVLWGAASLLNCAGVSNLKSIEEKSYTPHFLEKIGQIKESYKKGQNRIALSELEKMQGTGEYSSIERAYANNLMGIIFFSMGNLNRSEGSFLRALSNYNYKSFLRARVHLNLASLYYKKNLYNKSYIYLIKLDSELLEKRDKEQFYELGRIVGKELDQKMLWVASLVGIVGEGKTIEELTSHALFETLRANYLELSNGEKVKIFEKGKKGGGAFTGWLSFLFRCKEEVL